MIRHIVFFKFKKNVPQDERTELAKNLCDLEKKINYIRALEVSWDIGGKDNSFDMALNSIFDSMEDVEKYSVHPAHVEVVGVIKKLCEQTVKVDYDTSLVAM